MRKINFKNKRHRLTTTSNISKFSFYYFNAIRQLFIDCPCVFVSGRISQAEEEEAEGLEKPLHIQTIENIKIATLKGAGMVAIGVVRNARGN